MRHTGKWLFGAVALAAVMRGPTVASATEVEVVHWSTSGAEQAAVSVFAREFEKGGDTWKDTAIAGAPNARAAMMQRTLGGDPPGAAQFSPGGQYEELIAGGLLLDLAPLAEKEGWAKIVNPPEILAPCIRDGKVWCVPVDIHSWQWGWASVPVFEKSGVPLPKNLDEFLAEADKIKAAGFIPFAIGGETWQHSGALNVVLLSQVGSAGWTRLYRDRDADYARGPEVKHALDTFRKLVSYRDEGSANRSWNDTTNLIITDKAALQIMGDWARGEFALAGEVAGKDYACIPGPSEDPYLDTVGDIFLFPKQSDPEVEKAQLRMASMMISPSAQVAFNLAKGSLPVRGDIDLSAADDCMKKGLELLRNPDRVVQPVNEYLTGDSTSQINDLFAEFVTNDTLTVDEAQERYAKIIETAK